MGKQSSAKGTRSAREAAAAARAASIAAEKRRQRMINITIAVVIAAVVIAIVGGALLISNQTKEQNTVNPDAAAPAGAFPTGSDLAYGIPYGSDPDAPQFVAWEDFQCPGCQAFENANGAAIRELADNGEIYQITRVTTFLDNNLATDHSRRASAAYGCAVDAGQGMDYKEIVYANAPGSEGTGWTDEQLIDFGRQAGIEGDAFTTFESCFTDRTFLQWAANSTDQFYALGIPGTPYLTLNGKEITTKQVADPATFQQLIAEANAAQ